MNDTDRAVIFYAKGWYVRQNPTKKGAEQKVEDLLYIFSELYEYKYCLSDLWEQMVNVFMTYVSDYWKRDFLSRIFRDERTISFRTSADIFQCIHSMLGKLSVLKVQGNNDMIDLGQPDYDKFPLLATPEVVGKAEEFFKRKYDKQTKKETNKLLNPT